MGDASHALPAGQAGPRPHRDLQVCPRPLLRYGTGPAGEEYDFFQALAALPITNLKIAGRVVMVDDPPHWWAMMDHAAKYRGHVLVAGLGLGLIVHALAANQQVERITVVEREPDVIAAVAPHLPGEKLRIVEGDFFNYHRDFEPEGVFFDLFVGNGHELMQNAVSMSFALRRRFPAAEVLRIHGFNNDALARLVAIATAAGKLSEDGI